MTHIALGGYRLSIQSREHEKALQHALESGVTLIDTSANYTDGDSERLIGKVLSENPQYRPLIVTKGGYIQGQNLVLLEQLKSQNLAKTDIVDLGEHLKHSIHPEFLKSQIDQSLARMKLNSIDVYLLHNPEYYFQEPNATADEFYRRITLAFEYLEKEVNSGRIKEYGISSNYFVNSPSDPTTPSIDRIHKIASDISPQHHFKWIQFPFNLIEIGALERYEDGLNLVEKAQRYDLKTMINRPLNAFTNNTLLRLATYEMFIPQDIQVVSQNHLNLVMSILEKKWMEHEDAQNEKLQDIPLIKQFLEIWNQLPSPDSVDQVFHGHFFPLVAQIWGSDLTAQESQPFYDLYESSLHLSRLQMSQKAKEFEKQAVELGLIAQGTTPLAVKVLETYTQYGLDYILVGMRNEKYVDQLKHLF